MWYFFSGLLGTLFRRKKGQHLPVPVFYIIGGGETWCLCDNVYSKTIEMVYTIVGLNAVWNLHETWDHDLVLAYLGTFVFVPTEKAYGKFVECVKLEWSVMGINEYVSELCTV